MSTHSTQAARSAQWEVDDAAPTRIRWEKAGETPSELEATRVFKQEDALRTQPDFPDFADELGSDAQTRIRLWPGQGALARMASNPDLTADHPFLLARRANKNGSAPSGSDLPSADRDSWIPDEPPESGPRLIQGAPPAHAWTEPPTVVAAPMSLPVRAASEPPLAVITPAAAPPSPLRLILISMCAFALTMSLALGVAARYLATAM